ncbi:hypothetical protein ADUPG1_007062 [Aduncisulcus paluster]|uniref:Flavin reductase like domain-containing protein n=1 Tax=Aduncisulcus paluster TaxID=2918883 RepID=A0ABQ5KKK7_9EUKA|nr:hypothetical protein ADUPG1_007062 [Aduncisulcus paluster]
MGKVELHHSKLHGSLVSTVTAVGTRNLDGSPNYGTFAFITWINIQPLMICIGMNKGHNTLKNIRREKQFSVNIGSIETLDEVNFAGITKDPIKNGKFETFYHEEDSERLCPMAGNLPICMSFSLVDIHDYPTSSAVIGKLESSLADESVLDPEKTHLDMRKVNPLLFSFSGPSYFSLGAFEGKPWAKEPRADIAPKDRSLPDEKE